MLTEAVTADEAVMDVAVLGNCQAPIWADALRALNSRINVVHFEHVGVAGRTLDDATASVRTVNPDVVLVIPDFLPRVREEVQDERSRVTTVIGIPSITFSGFHPDLAYVRKEGGGIIPAAFNTQWSSKVLFWCHQQGVSLSNALSLYTHDGFESLGYFEAWEHSVRALRDVFEFCDLDFSSWFLHVKRHGVFMHGINHPRPVAVLAAAVQTVTGRLALSVTNPEAALRYVPDRLATNVVWPVHAPIAARLSVPSSDIVKIADRYVTWPQFAESCFRYWDTLPAKSLPMSMVPAISEQQTEVFEKLPVGG